MDVDFIFIVVQYPEMPGWKHTNESDDDAVHCFESWGKGGGGEDWRAYELDFASRLQESCPVQHSWKSAVSNKLAASSKGTKESNPKCSMQFILWRLFPNNNVKVASVCGSFYGLDIFMEDRSIHATGRVLVSILLWGSPVSWQMPRSFNFPLLRLANYLSETGDRGHPAVKGQKFLYVCEMGKSIWGKFGRNCKGQRPRELYWSKNSWLEHGGSMIWSQRNWCL